MVNSHLVGCGQRIVWAPTQAIRATSLMSGVPDSSKADGHARQKHHRIHATPLSVSAGRFDVGDKADVFCVASGDHSAWLPHASCAHGQLMRNMCGWNATDLLSCVDRWRLHIETRRTRKPKLECCKSIYPALRSHRAAVQIHDAFHYGQTEAG
jgi:hypothetical protein